jgi:hypothetical protein
MRELPRFSGSTELADSGSLAQIEISPNRSVVDRLCLT